MDNVLVAQDKYITGPFGTFCKVLNGSDSNVLSLENQNGKARFKKEILNIGSFVNPLNPSETLSFDEARFQTWIDNFKNVLKDVFVPIRHTDNPLRNSGWVKDLWVEDGGLWADIEITEPDVANLIRNGTIRGDSVLVQPYVDPKTGKVFECLWHVALTNTPHVRDLAPFAELEGVANFKDKMVIFESNKKGSDVKILSEIGKWEEDKDKIFVTVRAENIFRKDASFRGTNFGGKLPLGVEFIRGQLAEGGEWATRNVTFEKSKNWAKENSKKWLVDHEVKYGFEAGSLLVTKEVKPVTTGEEVVSIETIKAKLEEMKKSRLSATSSAAVTTESAKKIEEIRAMLARRRAKRKKVVPKQEPKSVLPDGGNSADAEKEIAKKIAGGITEQHEKMPIENTGMAACEAVKEYVDSGTVIEKDGNTTFKIAALEKLDPDCSAIMRKLGLEEVLLPTTISKFGKVILDSIAEDVDNRYSSKELGNRLAFVVAKLTGRNFDSGEKEMDKAQLEAKREEIKKKVEAVRARLEQRRKDRAATPAVKTEDRTAKFEEAKRKLAEIRARLAARKTAASPEVKLEDSKMKTELEGLRRSNEILQKRMVSLEAQNEAVEKEKMTSEIEQLVRDGKIPPAVVDNVKKVVFGARASVVKFEDGKSESTVAAEVLGILKALPSTRFEENLGRVVSNPDTGGKKFLTREDHLRLSARDANDKSLYQREREEGKIIEDHSTGKAYWVV